jgi:hypothetical protein
MLTIERMSDPNIDPTPYRTNELEKEDSAYSLMSASLEQVSSPLVSPSYEVQVGKNGKVYLTVIGEGDDESDITEFVAPLLAAAPLPPWRSSQNAQGELADHSVIEQPLGEPVAGELVDFATIACTDEVVFTRDGEPIPQQEGLQLLSDRIVDALRRSVEHHSIHQAEVSSQ